MKIIQGNALNVLRNMADNSINCVVTSPPYYGLRDYGVAGQIGLEKTHLQYVKKLVTVFREVRRVLAKDGTCWLNLGDSYATGAGKAVSHGGGKEGKRWAQRWTPNDTDPSGQKADSLNQPNRMKLPGLKAKEVIGIPWRIAFALQSAGWYLRQDLIWHKPNPKPESVQDRCTRAHEYVFLLTKSKRYWWDQRAMQEPATDKGRFNGRAGRTEPEESRPPGSAPNTLKRLDYSLLGRNKRSVWTFAGGGLQGKHYAVFPLELAELCILAGCPEGGTVLDPFSGSGTTGLAAIKNNRKYVGIELNPDYVRMAEERAQEHYPLFAGAPK